MSDPKQVLVVGSSFAGPQAHWAKIAFERGFLTSRRHGMVAV